MKKRTYRRIAVKEVDEGALAAEVGSGRVVFAIDVAKVDMVAAIVAGDGRVVRTVGRFGGRIRQKMAWFWHFWAGLL
jgi:hypothetical protein